MELSKEKKSPTVRHLGQKYWRQFLTVKISAENSFSTPDFFYFWSHFWTVSSSPSYKSSFDSFLRGASIELSKAKKSQTVRRWGQKYRRQFFECQNVRKKSDFWFGFFLYFGSHFQSIYTRPSYKSSFDSFLQDASIACLLGTLSLAVFRIDWNRYPQFLFFENHKLKIGKSEPHFDGIFTSNCKPSGQIWDQPSV